MTKTIFSAFALVAFTLTSCAQINADLRRAQLAPVQPAASPGTTNETTGRALFLRNCAHCHGATAHGDDGPDLHNLDWTDEQIAARIRNGRKGQMTAFAGKLQPPEIDALVKYLRTLK